MEKICPRRLSRCFWVFLFIAIVFVSVGSFSVIANTISVHPSSTNLVAGESFTIDINLSVDEPVKSFECAVSFTASAFSVLSVVEGDFFDGYDVFFNDGTIDNTHGVVSTLYGLILGPGNVTSDGTLFTLQCKAKNPSSDITSPVTLSNAGITNESDYLVLSILNSSVFVEASESSPPSGGGGGGGGVIPPEEEPIPVEPRPPVTPESPNGTYEATVDVDAEFFVSSWDPDGDTLRFMMNWGDGNLSDWSDYVNSNETVGFDHYWTTPGNYEIRVSAEDDTGLQSNWSLAHVVAVLSDKVQILPPSENLTVASNISLEDDTIEFSLDDLEGMDLSEFDIMWDFGDGSTGVGINPTHAYELPGEYTVTITLSDGSGNTTVKTFIMSVPVLGDTSNEPLTSSDADGGFVGWWLLIVGIVAAVGIGLFIFFRYFQVSDEFMDILLSKIKGVFQGIIGTFKSLYNRYGRKKGTSEDGLSLMNDENSMKNDDW